ncbi:g7691 [Coccomyxa viridis]|uniref:asparagine--tRNA ligase n=1 Tax=Coccomyxa viridis TaxID=1274662 RepID=A0ABP1G3E0_9CHLO
MSSMPQSAPPAAAENGLHEDELEAITRQIHELQLKQEQLKRDRVVAPYSRSYGRTLISTIVESADGGVHLEGQTISIGGWVKTGREAGAGRFVFLDVNDGTSAQGLQAVVSSEVAEAVGGFGSLTPSGTSVLLQGELTKTPEGTKQPVELKVSKVVLVGPCDNSAGKYALAKKKMTMEFLRGMMHLRPRTNTIAAVARIRNALSKATHDFFQTHGFLYLHTPLITTSDCEGAGEMFQVTTLLSKAERAQAEEAPVSDEEIAQLEKEVSEQGQVVTQVKEDFKADKQNKELQKRQSKEEKKLKESKQRLDELKAKADVQRRTVGGILRRPDGTIAYEEDFFGESAFLTVSGQMNGEYYACALSNVYTFGPTFRAENSNTTRHLAEFWMIEPELAYADLEDDMNCAEDYVRYCCKYLLETCPRDMEFMTKMVDKGAMERLRMVASTPFERCTYTRAIELLEEAVKGGKKFEFPVSWGIDLASEHERYLTEEIFKKPTIVYNYPKDIKAFYMRLNDDGKTVAAMDVLVPGVGELIGGSQREERLEVLEERLEAAGMPKEPYSGYLDLRRYGTVPHSGFGLGFERLILFATGLDNIREAIPFPRWPGHADF